MPDRSSSIYDSSFPLLSDAEQAIVDDIVAVLVRRTNMEPDEALFYAIQVLHRWAIEGYRKARDTDG